jgi:hypothetical protein
MIYFVLFSHTQTHRKAIIFEKSNINDRKTIKHMHHGLDTNLKGRQPKAPAAFTPQEIFLVLISVRG